MRGNDLNELKMNGEKVAPNNITLNRYTIDSLSGSDGFES